MSSPVKWFNFKDPDGNAWEVKFSSSEISPSLKADYDGITECGKNLITLDAATLRDIQDYIVLHEVMHACLAKSDVYLKSEEKVITELAPRLYYILKRFGLKWPARPGELKPLERKTRRKNKKP